ncbi:hypothetical protein BDQ17DRAFT_1422154 [Cyathus striatus]|nr:hypothetical protein BDQ17DRAFT_1422154 [Cyathus striatus]
MPSIRIRGSYASLGDEEENRPRSLASIFYQPAVQSTTPRTRPSLPTLRTNEEQDFSLRSHSYRSSRALLDHAPSIDATFAHPPPQDLMVTIEGSQADILVPSHLQPGRIESNLSLPQTPSDSQHPRLLEPDDHHHDDIVEHLDVIDPHIGAITSLTNAANSILIPPSTWYSRKPVVILSSPTRAVVDKETSPEEFEDSLDRHVDDVLKRPSKWRRTLMGVWAFLKTPMGIVAGIYGFLVVFWGAAIVIFLVKIINFHNSNTQGFWVEVSSQIENGLFTVTGVGLIPSRTLDTYRIYKIWHYKRKTIKLRQKAGLPQLFDVDDLPDPVYDPNYVHVLTKDEQDDLHRQQVKFQHHQTWYRAHGTETHRAFPIKYGPCVLIAFLFLIPSIFSMALAICFLNDGNSVFQVILCGTMWGLNRFERPAWSTGTLIPQAFYARVEEVRERLRAALATQSPINNELRHASDSATSAPPENGYLEKATQDSSLKVLGVNDSSVTVDEHMTVPPLDSKKDFR